MNETAKRTIKIAAILVSLPLAAYQLYFFILPAVTVVNTTGSLIENARVDLPNSGLDFGDIGSGRENTIYYSLEQSDGEYQYLITIQGGLVLSGTCGVVTNNEFHKRLVIRVQEGEVICDT